ncbi:hypothetical protein MHYP_G00361190 [Metynnis hypsauchen]
MMKLMAVKIAKVKAKKSIKDLFLYSFGLLLNTASLTQMKILFRRIVCVFMAKKETNDCKHSLRALKKAIDNQSTDLLGTSEVDICAEGESHEQVELGVKKSSPFAGVMASVFQHAHERSKFEADDDDGTCTENSNFCPELVDLLERYTGTIPLWSGVMLKQFHKTRDTNAPVENWFRTTKRIVLRNQLHRRPGDFLQIMREFVAGRVRGMTLMSPKRQKKIRSEMKGLKDTKMTEEDHSQQEPFIQEEKWQKRLPRKKPKYFTAPLSKTATETNKNCPPWSGRGRFENQTIQLTNTCTVDNLLYTIHLSMKKFPKIVEELESLKNKDQWIDCLLKIHCHFTNRQWTEGKILWLSNFPRFQGKKYWDCFGSEEDFISCRLDYLQATQWEITCSSENCPLPSLRRTSNLLEVPCNNFTALQNSIDSWAEDSQTVCRRKK